MNDALYQQWTTRRDATDGDGSFIYVSDGKDYFTVAGRVRVHAANIRYTYLFHNFNYIKRYDHATKRTDTDRQKINWSSRGIGYM